MTCFALILTLLLQSPPDDWIPVETYDTITAIDFSPFQGDDSVISSYSVHILEEKLPIDLSGIESFKIEVVLKSGYTITNVTDLWEKDEVETASGSAKLKAIKLTVKLEGWDYWDVEIFSVTVGCKLKQGWGKKI